MCDQRRKSHLEIVVTFRVLKKAHSAYVLSMILCALLDDCVVYHLPFDCRHYDLVRSSTTIRKLLAKSFSQGHESLQI